MSEYRVEIVMGLVTLSLLAMCALVGCDTRLAVTTAQPEQGTLDRIVCVTSSPQDKPTVDVTARRGTVSVDEGGGFDGVCVYLKGIDVTGARIAAKPSASPSPVRTRGK